MIKDITNMTRIYLFIAYILIVTPIVYCTNLDAKKELKKINKDQIIIDKYLKDYKK